MNFYQHLLWTAPVVLCCFILLRYKPHPLFICLMVHLTQCAWLFSGEVVSAVMPHVPLQDNIDYIVSVLKVVRSASLLGLRGLIVDHMLAADFEYAISAMKDMHIIEYDGEWVVLRGE